MQLLNIHSYAYYGNKQFPVDIPIVTSTAFVNAVKDSPSTFQRDYQNLSVATPQSTFKRNFGIDIYAALKRVQYYIGVKPNQSGIADMSMISDTCRLLDINTPSYLAFNNSYTPGVGVDFYRANEIISSMGDDFTLISYSDWQSSCGILATSGTEPVLLDRFTAGSFLNNHIRQYDSSHMAYCYFEVLPDDIFYNGKINPAYHNVNCRIYVEANIYWSSDYSKITRIRFYNVEATKPTLLEEFFGSVEIPDYTIETEDIENPYGEDGTSTSGGGDGDLGPGGLDSVDPTEIPELPDVSAVATGFITMYNPTSANLSALGNFLWSGQFDLDTYKKLFADPMQGIIGLGIVPALPNSGGSRNIMFGNVDTGVNCSYLASQYAKKDCGSVEIKKYVGSFLDNSPFVKLSLFLPYIGFVNLGTDDIMGGSINVQYNIDVLTGDCIAFIKHNTKGVLYAYHGNCLTNVPVSGQNYANALKNYYESVAGIIPATTNGAAGGPIGAIAGAATGALNAASNVVLNSKPTFQRSGNIGGSAGILGVQKPFVIIERPNISVPNKVQHYLGQTSNITMNLGSCSGLTVVEAVHLNGISATSKELAEIDSLLKGGVIL